MILSLELARTSEGSKAGPIGLAVILVLCIACYFLFKSMSTHMRKVREEFPTDTPPARSAATAKVAPPAKVVPPAEAVPLSTTKDTERPAGDD
jgi:hypothetical protein